MAISSLVLLHESGSQPIWKGRLQGCCPLDIRLGPVRTKYAYPHLALTPCGEFVSLHLLANGCEGEVGLAWVDRLKLYFVCDQLELHKGQVRHQGLHLLL